MSKVAIVGTGLVTCLGAGVTRTFEEMCAGKCGVREIDRFPVDQLAQQRGGQLDGEVEGYLREKYGDMDLALAMVIESGTEALKGINRGDERRCGLILATNFGSMETLEWCRRERIDNGETDSETFKNWCSSLDIVAKALSCEGPKVELALSCASGGGAAALAKEWIETGRADRVVAVAYDALAESTWTGLANLRTITTDAVRPFDVNRSGTIFSEGAAAMVVQNTSLPGTPKAYLYGAAVNNNAFHMTAPPKEAEGSRRVMESALADAGVSKEQIGHISAHATATSANDPTESAAFRNLFGDQLDSMTVAAHKSQFGHMMGGAGLAEAVITIEVLASGKVPPTINHGEMDPECTVPVNTKLTETRAKIAITNSAGIGGNNSSLVIGLEDV